MLWQNTRCVNGIINNRKFGSETLDTDYSLNVGYLSKSPDAFPLEPEMAVFAPVNMLHKIVVGPDEDLTYVVVYAPPGPEQQLKKLGEHAFDAPK